MAIWSLAIRNRSGPIPRQEQLEVVDARDGVRRPIREEPNDRDRKRKRVSARGSSWRRRIATVNLQQGGPGIHPPGRCV